MTLPRGSDIVPPRFWLPPAASETDVLRFAMAERERARYRVVLELMAEGYILHYSNAADLALRGQ